MYYKAPETLLGIRKYGIPVDIWSLGCILAELFLGRPIFLGKSETDQMMKVFKVLGKPKIETWPSITDSQKEIYDQLPRFPDFTPTGFAFIKNEHPEFDENAFDLINKMLVLNPVQRLTARQILSHCWFKGVRID